MKGRTFCTYIFILLISGSALIASAQGKATSKFILDGKTYNISHVTARTDENAFDETKKDVVLTLTDQPAPENKSDVVAQAESGKLHGVIVSINDQKEPYSMVILGVAQKSGTGICGFEAKKFDTTAVAGRVFTESPEESFGHKYEFDIQVDTAVKDTVQMAVNEKTGTPLPAGGGEPGKAYIEYDKIMAKGDLVALKKFLANDEARKSLDDPKAKQMIEMMKAMRATEIKIVSGFVSGDRATLMVEGKDPGSGEKTTGTIRMTKVNNIWMVEKESWKQ